MPVAVLLEARLAGPVARQREHTRAQLRARRIVCGEGTIGEHWMRVEEGELHLLVRVVVHRRSLAIVGEFVAAPRGVGAVVVEAHRAAAQQLCRQRTCRWRRRR